MLNLGARVSAVIMVAVVGSGGAMAWPASAQAPYRVLRLQGTVVLDGRMDEDAWRSIPLLPLTLHQPTFGGTATERTDIRVTYDERYFYVGADLFDSDPHGVQARSLVRDVDAGGDFLNVLLDTFNDNENAVTFTTTPSGSRLDYVVSADAEGPNGASNAWNGVWDAVTSRDSSGWHAEMRIPFTTLRYQGRGGLVTMGLIVNRLIGRKNERVIFPAIPPNWDLAPFKPSQAQDIVLEGVPERRVVYLAPYLVGSRIRPDVDDRAARLDAGGDVKIGVSDQATLDATINTDFAEVESDDIRINLTRFPLFFPEKRQFFLERSGVFDFTTGEGDRLFHSRRIGLGETGERVPIVVGGRLVGRFGHWDVGALIMLSGHTDATDNETISVARLKRQLFNPFSYLGVAWTSRVGESRTTASEVGVDGSVRLSRDHYVAFDAVRQLRAPSESPGGRAEFLPEGTARVVLERRTLVGFGFRAGVKSTGSSYQPGLGFVERTGVTRGEITGRYGITPAPTSILRRYTPSVAAVVHWRIRGGGVESRIITPKLEAETKSGVVVRLGLSVVEERLREGFLLEDKVEVPAGSYRFSAIEAEFQSAPGWPITADAKARAGDFYDGSLTSLILSPRWNASAHLRLEGEYQLDRARFSSRHQSLTSHIARLRGTLAFNAKLSVAALVQHSSSLPEMAGNVRLRYNFREGQDLWVVLNQGFTAREPLTSPPTLETTQGITIKYSTLLQP